MATKQALNAFKKQYLKTIEKQHNPLPFSLKGFRNVAVHCIALKFHNSGIVVF